MVRLAPSILERANRLLGAYGGLQGLATQPAWLISYVLKTFFDKGEANKILAYVSELAENPPRRR